MSTDDDALGIALEGLTDEDLRNRVGLVRKLAENKKYCAMDWWKPYPKQIEHFAHGATYRERLLTACNQGGKSTAGSYEMACHLTGLYPEWWAGRRWDRPIRGWACGKTGQLTRDIVQLKLCGEPGVTDALGSGMLPRSTILDTSLSSGVRYTFDTVQVRHVSGGSSTLNFKTYEQGREKFEGGTLDFIWDDEEPPYDIFIEQLARLGPLRGMIAITFTSTRGPTKVTDVFFRQSSPDRIKTTMGVMDTPHLDPAVEMAKYPKHQWPARLYGGIIQGEGRVFDTIDREMLSEPTIALIPEHWRKIWGLDFGIAHYFAAALIAIDPDTGCVHVLQGIRMKDAFPLQHAVPIKTIGADVPVAWPHDGARRDPGSGEPLSKLYKAQGLRTLDSHATFPDGSMSTEAGYAEMIALMQTGKFKVAAHLGDWFDEFDNLHRSEDLQIVKVNDDLLSATRIALMSKRFAKPVMLGSKRPPSGVANGPNAGLAQGVDFDVFV